jgi:endonuclease/exonuclease/phosphatase family metal-dependent hydrolase
VNRLREWEKVMRILGSKWDYIATDVTDPKLGGNGERMVFVYDTRKVSFQNIAGEIVLPTNMLISKVEADVGTDKFIAGKQFRRTPFLASFQAGWFKFDICTVHLYFGSSSGAKLQERVEEIDAVAKYFGERADIGLRGDRALILLGDFNIVSPEHKTMQALKKNGFRVPRDIGPTNVKGDKYYDQIAFKTKKAVLDYVDSNAEDPASRNAGVFDLFGSAFKTGQLTDYKAAMKTTSALSGKKYKGKFDKYYRDWRTYQLSDHNPLWVRLGVNESDKYLKGLKTA